MEIANVLSPFFVIIANPAAGTEAPLDVNVPMVVFTQVDGATMQAGIVKVVASAMK